MTFENFGRSQHRTRFFQFSLPSQTLFCKVIGVPLWLHYLPMSSPAYFSSYFSSFHRSSSLLTSLCSSLHCSSRPILDQRLHITYVSPLQLQHPLYTSLTSRANLTQHMYSLLQSLQVSYLHLCPSSSSALSLPFLRLHLLPTAMTLTLSLTTSCCQHQPSLLSLSTSLTIQSLRCKHLHVKVSTQITSSLCCVHHPCSNTQSASRTSQHL